MYDDVRFFSVNPKLILYYLDHAPWTYQEAFQHADKYRGYAKQAVLPSLFHYCYSLHRVPELTELYTYVKTHLCEPELQKDTAVLWRGIKLVFDFIRELYTFGLLQHSDLFGFVQYCKAYDLNYNVDFVGQLMPEFLISEDIGIQAMMRKNWKAGDMWRQTKERRRQLRGEHLFTGPIYELSNRNIPPAKNIKGLWLFGQAHIQELRERIIEEKSQELGIISAVLQEEIL